MIKQQNKNKTSFNNNIQAQDVTKPNNSVITDSKLNEKEVEDNSQIIKTFVEYCNENKLQEAYNILTNDCKEQLYSTMDIFKQNYINQIFKTKKSYKLELWAESNNYYTYRITYITGNVLQTGGYDTENNYIDYITVVKNDNEFKLNLNQFIKKENINKKNENDYINITINNRLIYLNYETYNITIENKTNNTILLNDKKALRSMYLLDRNDVQYISMINEIPDSMLTITPKSNTTINLKFNKIYNADVRITSMKINDIYLNKEEYDLNPNNENLEKINITINL